MPLKFFWNMEGRKKPVFRKIMQILSFCKMKSVQAHEIDRLAPKKTKFEKNSVDHAIMNIMNICVKRPVQTLIFVDLKWLFYKNSSFSVKIMVGC